jgi:hypothetical protein
LGDHLAAVSDIAAAERRGAMSKPKTHKENLVTWRTMLANLAPLLDQMPHLREQHAAFSALVERAERLEAQQSRCKAKLQRVNQERTAAALQGRRMRNRIAEGLRGVLGPESPQLIAFGVPPRPENQRRNRTTKAERAARAASAAAAGRAADPSLVN